MNSKKNGEISESQVLAKLLLKGETVLIPFGDNQRYDLVIEHNGIFERIQVKTGRLKNGAVRFFYSKFLQSQGECPQDICR